MRDHQLITARLEPEVRGRFFRTLLSVDGNCGARRIRVHIQKAYRLRKVHRKIGRSEEHTSELQSRQYLVCRLLLEKKKKKKKKTIDIIKKLHDHEQSLDSISIHN